MRKRREIVTVSEEFKFRGKAVSSAVIDDDDDYEMQCRQSEQSMLMWSG